MNTNKKSGETAECYFDYLAMVNGILISEPRGDSAPYDRITEFEGKLNRVQIKLKSTCRGVKEKTYSVTIARSHNKEYTNTEIDIVAIYLLDIMCWYFIPIKDITKSVYINPERDNLNMFKNNWEVFK